MGSRTDASRNRNDRQRRDADAVSRTAPRGSSIEAVPDDRGLAAAQGIDSRNDSHGHAAPGRADAAATHRCPGRSVEPDRIHATAPAYAGTCPTTRDYRALAREPARRHKTGRDCNRGGEERTDARTCVRRGDQADGRPVASTDAHVARTTLTGDGRARDERRTERRV